MVQFRFAVALWIINTIVDNPELVDLRIDGNTGYYTNALDHPMGIVTVLSPHQFNMVRIVLVYYGAIKNQKSILRSSMDNNLFGSLVLFFGVIL